MNDTGGSVNATPDPVNAQPPAAAAEATDAEFAAMLAKTITGGPTNIVDDALGVGIREAILRAIKHERERCAKICFAIRNSAIKTGAFAMVVVGNYQAANQGDAPDAAEAAKAAAQSELLAQAFNGAGRRIMVAPGSCPKCHGTKRAPSKSVRAADGSPVLVECEACKDAPAAAAAEGGPG